MSWAVTGDVGERGPAINLNGFKWLQIIQTKRIFNTVEKHWAVLNYERPSRKFDGIWKASYGPDEQMLQHREMSWPVFGGARPTVQSNVFDNLYNIKRKDFSTPWKELGITSNEKIFQHREKKWFFNTVKRKEPAMFLKSFISSRRENALTPWNELDRVWGSTTSRWFERCWQSA